MNFLGFYGAQPIVAYGGQMVSLGQMGFPQPIMGPAIHMCAYCGIQSFSRARIQAFSPEHDRNCRRFRGRNQQRSSSNSSSSGSNEGKTLTMFHGTSASNARSIEREGFRESEDGMLGRGVYLSRDISKAADYGSVVLRVSVNVGRVAKIDRQGHPLQKSWQNNGYDSAWVPPGCGMVSSNREENCIADPDRITILNRARS
jgi:hypothetical protein